MRRAATSAALVLGLLPAAAAAAGDAAPKRVEALVHQAAQLERAEDCEAAYARYREAEDLLAEVADRKRLAELEAVITSKIDKLEACYVACQPSRHQKAMVESARGYAEQGELRRAAAIVQRMLVGKNEKCRFWAEVRAFLRTLPDAEEELATLDPCDVTEDVSASLQAARAALDKHRQAFSRIESSRKRQANLDELIELYRAIDSTRLQVFELREEYADCDNVYKPLAEDSRTLRELFAKTQELIFTGYQTKLNGLSRSIRKFKRQLAERDKAIAELTDEAAARTAEYERMKAKLEELSDFNEKVYGDLLELAGAQAMSFSVEVEGRRIERPLEDIQALVADQNKVLEALREHYPEYFQDGVHLEGLKRKKFVLEKLNQLLARFGDQGADAKLGHARAMREIQATTQMIDKVIAAHSGAGKAPAATQVAGVPLWLGVPMGLGVVVLVVGAVMLVRRKEQGP